MGTRFRREYFWEEDVIEPAEDEDLNDAVDQEEQEEKNKKKTTIKKKNNEEHEEEKR